MFNLGLSEIFVIAAVALFLVKPEDVPKMARKAGKIMGMFKNYKDAFIREMDLSAGMKEPNDAAENDEGDQKTAEKEPE